MKHSSFGTVSETGKVDYDSGRRNWLQERHPQQPEPNVEESQGHVSGTEQHEQQQHHLDNHISRDFRFSHEAAEVEIRRNGARYREEIGNEAEDSRVSARPCLANPTTIQSLVHEPAPFNGTHLASSSIDSTPERRSRATITVAMPAVTKPHVVLLGESNRARRQRERRRRQRAKKAARKALCKKITLLGKEGRWQNAIATADSARASGLEPDVFVYGSCVGAAAHSGRWREAIELMRDMRAEGVHPNTEVYNAAIHACDRALRWRLSLRLLGEMRGCAGILSEWQTDDNNRDYENFLETFDSSVRTVEESKVAEDGIVGRPRGRSRRVVATPPKPEPDIQTFNSVMSACGKVGHWRLVLQVMQAAQERELVPTRVTYNTAISACARGGEVDTALSLLKEMPTVLLTPDVFSYNSAIAACASHGLWECALSLLTEMELSEDVHPDEYSFSSAITACARARKWAPALKLLDAMKLEGIKPGRVVLNAAINACGDCGQWKRALGLLREMQRKTRGEGEADADAVLPDSVSFNSAMKACGEAGQWKQALSLLEEMEHSSGYRQSGDYGRGPSTALADGIDPRRPLLPSPNAISYSTAIAACSRAGESERALALLDRMRTQGLAPSLTAFTAAMTACRQGGEPARVSDLLEQMFTYDVEPDAICYREALWCCAEASLCDLARKLLLEMETRNMPIDMNTSRALLVACTSLPGVVGSPRQDDAHR